MIRDIKQAINFLKAAKAKGWFSQWQQSGDVISKEDREKIQRSNVRHFLDEMQRQLEEEGK